MDLHRVFFCYNLSMKKCLTCELEKPIKDFYKRKNSKDGVNFHCKPCSREKRNNWNKEKDEEYWRYSSYRRASLSTGIPIAEIRAAFENQNKRCKICNRGETNKFLAVDHCHKTGKFRGLLCQKCNTGLGQFSDDTALLERAAKYLKSEI